MDCVLYIAQRGSLFLCTAHHLLTDNKAAETFDELFKAYQNTPYVWHNASELPLIIVHPLKLYSFENGSSFSKQLVSVLFFHQACNPRYPDFERTSTICASEGINNTLTRYRWLVSAPAGPDGVTSPMREVDFDTFFTSSKRITLDSVYFQAGSRVQCAARAVNSNGDEGLELSSAIFSVSVEEGGCKITRRHTAHTHTGQDSKMNPNREL